MQTRLEGVQGAPWGANLSILWSLCSLAENNKMCREGAESGEEPLTKEIYATEYTMVYVVDTELKG